MRAASVRFDDLARRTEPEPEFWAAAGSPPVRRRTLAPSAFRALSVRFVTLFSFLAIFLTPTGYAAGRPDPANQNGHFELSAAARRFGSHEHSDTAASHTASLIGQVRFNQKPIAFEHGVTGGPGAGDLEIQFAVPPSGALDRLDYRLLGFDTEWKEAGKERTLHYRLRPGHYEFALQAASGRLKGSVVESLPITVTPPYWQTARVRTLCILFLLLLVLLLHRLRVRFLKKHNLRLQEAVNQTRAELTLTARTARDAQEALKEQALKDGLTGLWNRRAIFAMLEKEIYRAQRNRFPVTVVMIDLDHFKRINDTFGHPTGDEVLREASARLTEVMRPYDFIGRYGGEEFLVVLPSCSSHHGVQRAEEFRRAIAARPVFTAAGQLNITCSVGVAAYDEAMPPDDLIHRADEALYHAKRMGRNCVCAGNQNKPANHTRPVGRVEGPLEDPSRGDRARAG